jgi:hypothetical protein
MVSDQQDPKHPKLATVVNDVVEKWRRGEKVLIFCFRVQTATRLQEILHDRIGKELATRRSSCLGGAEAFRSLRARMTGRDRDLINLGLDRVLWSCASAARLECLSWVGPVPEPSWFVLSDGELELLASVAIRFGVNLSGDRIDRVFLCRATEHILAKRIRATGTDGPPRELVDRMADLTWVSHPYGLEHKATQDEGEDDHSEFDERGVHSVYVENKEPDPSTVKRLAGELAEKRQRAGGRALLDAYAHYPSLWFCGAPAETFDRIRSDGETSLKAVGTIHNRLWRLTQGGGGIDLQTRAMVMQALRRAVLRESVLLRLLPDRTERDQAGWGQLLAAAFYKSLEKQHESMADRIAVFLEDIDSASGSLQDLNSARYALFDATKLRDQQFVALVKGSGGGTQGTRDRVFMGFNTPLLPEVLVCTSVGQEGIDLHRHCRHVVHYDLAWNPAVLEQRTGRTDRIGSKTFRERSAPDGADVVLDIGVPYLAGTYDERMYEELRLRAQMFEVLTGGDYAVDQANNGEEGQEGQTLNLSVTPLPPSMLEHLRVSLNVWNSPDAPVQVGWEANIASGQVRRLKAEFDTAGQIQVP